ncbi:MAG: hypothetical protein A3E01_05995 [Gammaproteobacteria bacterium RIFCSPHIGHO2_12_FULL_63_22]|nr:MAG: hypothetical protein A3E01_05995 [Gammaproteobacteria bacterium RIFCSPHIGHO2_12_FULL_63_22]
MFRRAIVALLALSLAPAAWADARQELHQAFVRNMALKSFKATMVDLSSNKTVSVVEFQAPDRFRVTPTGAPSSVIVGDTMYMSIDGRTMKMPMPKGTFGKYRNEDAIKDLEKGTVVESRGMGRVGAQPARLYRFLSAKGKDQYTSTVWVGVASGQVLQLETSGKSAGKPFSMRMLYTDFNSPKIKVNAPN